MSPPRRLIVGPDGLLAQGGPDGGVAEVTLDLRGAQPLLFCAVERDGSLVWFAPDNLTAHHLTTLHESFMSWLAQYRAHQARRIQTAP